MKNKLGNITTFYSFKGGVGRTMAMANVGFLAAMSGSRVLLMDWDLEAPGLPYYFRGLCDRAEVKSIKDAPGILNLAWDWHSTVSAAEDPNTIEDIFQRYSGNDPFEKCLRPLISEARLPLGARLDLISAGSEIIDKGLSYEQALSELSWSQFFENEAGGFLIQRLKEWAKNSYDFILIDSRTGFADVAGVCTMQIPDSIALCFVLNRQNIDGISKVADVVRKQAPHINLRAVPMRIARENTNEESDARARAKRSLVRVAGLPPELVEHDVSSLPVRASPNIPFYETLAPFSVPDPSKDVLSLDYIGITRDLLGIEVEIPNIDQIWREEVRRRLEPRQATISYINELRTAEPTRAVDEINKLIESVIHLEENGEDLDVEYVQILVDTALQLERDYPFIEDESEELTASIVGEKAIDLARSLSSARPAEWRVFFVDTLEKYYSTHYFRDQDDEISHLEELDGLLSLEKSIPAVLLRRFSYRRRIARLNFLQGSIDAAMASTFEADAFSGLLKEYNDRDLNIDVTVGDADTLLTRGDCRASKGEQAAAIQDYESAINRLSRISDDARVDASRLKFDLHCRLAVEKRKYAKSEPNEAAQHALLAAEYGANTSAIAINFLDLAEAVLSPPDNSEFVLGLIRRIFAPQRRRPINIGTIFGRTPRAFTDLCKAALRLCEALPSAGNDPAQRDAVDAILQAVGSAWMGAMRHGSARFQAISPSRARELREILPKLYDYGLVAQLPPDSLRLLSDAIASFKPASA